MSNLRDASDERSFSTVGGVFTCVQDGPGAWTLCGELDADGVPLLRDRLIGVVGDVILDCSGLTFLDSSGLSLFIATQRDCRARGSKMVIVDPSPCVIRLLELTNLSSLLLDGPSTRSAP
jgi:anti-anti-sigma factor